MKKLITKIYKWIQSLKGNSICVNKADYDILISRYRYIVKLINALKEVDINYRKRNYKSWYELRYKKLLKKEELMLKLTTQEKKEIVESTKRAYVSLQPISQDDFDKGNMTFSKKKSFKCFVNRSKTGYLYQLLLMHKLTEEQIEQKRVKRNKRRKLKRRIMQVMPKAESMGISLNELTSAIKIMTNRG
jgi:hypothetical protein